VASNVGSFKRNYHTATARNLTPVAIKRIFFIIAFLQSNNDVNPSDVSSFTVISLIQNKKHQFYQSILRPLRITGNE
jgi:hypothetical protein